MLWVPGECGAEEPVGAAAFKNLECRSSTQTCMLGCSPWLPHQGLACCLTTSAIACLPACSLHCIRYDDDKAELLVDVMEEQVGRWPLAAETWRCFRLLIAAADAASTLRLQN